ncbi:hypothetical protein [Amycolatopsis keratiniphila]|uniref:hypothetical protein n=1 Tax=Amycolatopsis keratiniphila TaxID=129921 RepID=UPI00087B6C4A|nr:hypothetical protein [Amycolatopsis keratiniphila]OLZ56094.1 hypothetical protein BS330_18365 [Amycolatopsis keratiniphila subsp. nogabecina]SDU51748.1 hypothetical protein SAMN04489733_5337 [Amycolatopsis keratiniphila]
MGWLFETKRDPDDPEQLAIAVHELGHAWAWKDGGLSITEIRHQGDEGHVKFRYREQDWGEELALAYCVGCWAGFEAEDRWRKANGLGRAKRGHSSYDIGNFKHVARGMAKRPSESAARSLACKRIAPRWSLILRQAPVLVRDGRISI